ncbi:MAG TPA: acetyl-CoA carboxylase carboxyltransferase subunit alpha [Caulobacteraceae bacterium]|jgi:acetyl-CoA carboxylase carboxyl transferase subunit alpha|nr:acetyl-CoA carboxylase carboxyltransferase subunit alpha [Caulobacteraceae bacterium]
MASHYLEFERPIGELETKIEELSKLSGGPGGIDTEIAALRTRVAEMRRDTYSHLDAWQKTLIARHPERPHFIDYVGGLIEEFVELRGDRAFADDQAIMGGLGRFRGQGVVIIGQEKGHDTNTRIKHNFGAARPEGYRKAVRLMDLAEQFGLPVISLVDTSGAYPGLGSEERGVAEAIARGTERCLTLATPMVCAITGEGMSGGALGIACGNRVLMMEHAIYSVITPEGCASILVRDGTKAEGAAKAMKITAQDLIGFRIIDKIIPEPLGGAHADPAAAIKAVGDAVEAELKELSPLSASELRAQRAARFLAIGR